MNILWPDIHKNLTKSMAKAFDLLNYNIIIPSKDYNIKHRPPKQFSQFVWNEEWTQEKANIFFDTKNVKILSKEQILDLKPEVVFITNFESQFEILEELYPILNNKSKFAFYSGNDYWDGAYPFFKIKNYLCADYTGYLLSRKYNLNYLYYKPWVDYDNLKFAGYSDQFNIGIYISEYEKNFSKEYQYSKHLEKLTPWINYIYNTKSTHQEVLDSLHKSIATQHIKSLEGYGIAIIESMACGRPVFLHRQLSMNKSLLQWSIENATALFFDSDHEYISKLKSFIDSKDYRYYLQETCSKTIRKIIDNKTETENLNKFLINLN